MIWVEQSNSGAIGQEGERSLITRDLLIGEVLEDLLKGRLSDTVFFNAHVFLFKLKLTEKPANSLTFLWYSEFEELSALLQNLNLFEVTG